MRISALLVCLSLSLLAACTPTPPSNHQSASHFEGEAMTMSYQVIIPRSLSQEQKLEVQTTIEEVFDHVNHHLNHWNEASELSQINQLKSYEALLISQDLARLFHLSQKLHLLSQCKFDPTLKTITHQLKHNLPMNRSLPTGLEKFHLEGKVLTKEESELALDFDALTKGYCVDLLVDALQNLGYKDLFVSWGGEIKAMGRPNKKRPWNVSLRSPFSPHPKDAIEIIPLENASVATSGDYLQQFDIDDRKVTHILNPKTLTPLAISPHSIASVSVKAHNCALADGLATATMLMQDENEMKQWLKMIKTHYPHVEMWVVRRQPHSIDN